MDQQHWSSSSSLTLVLGDKPHVIHSEITLLNQLSFCNTEHASLRNASQWFSTPPVGVGSLQHHHPASLKDNQTCNVIATLV